MKETLTDNRKRRSVLQRTVLTMVLVGFITQKPSFYQIFNQSNFKKRMSHLFDRGKKLPEVDCARAVLEQLDAGELTTINAEVVQTIRKNKVFSKGTIDGLVVIS